jgi:hypothetical protein
MEITDLQQRAGQMLEKGNTMESYPYEYDRYNRSRPGKPQQQQNYEGRNSPANSNQQQSYVPGYQWLPQAGAAQQPNQAQGYAPMPTRQRVPQAQVSQGLNQQQGYAPTKQRMPQAGTTQKPKGPKPMAKARALALVNTLKKSLVVASLATFVSFSGLAAFHQVSTTASKTASTSSTSSQSSGKNVLKQTGGSNIGTSSSSGSSSSSSQGTSSSSTGSSSSSSSSAVSGSSVS